MEILIDNSTDFIISDEYMRMIENIIRESLSTENFTENIEVSISLVDNKEIHELNKKFRNMDKPTDVLSFPLLDFSEEVNFSNFIVLGDIVVSVERVREQAKEYGHSFEREFGFMLAHSMLHLLGYDHETEEDEKQMFAKQDAILNAVNLFR